VTAPALDDLIRRTEDIREKYPHYWRDEQAQAELKALWVDAVNANGVFVNDPDEVLYDRDGCRAVIRIGTANGVYAFGCGFQTPTQGYGSSPSIWGELFASHAEARSAAIDYLLKRLPATFYPHEEHLRGKVERMREAIAAPLLQPSLF
jgi:hypothetical protein